MGENAEGRAQAPVTGKEAVIEAIMEAATELFAQKAPSQVSVREIAAHADVNHGLIHRHFGSKKNLIAEVIQANDAKLSEVLDGESSFMENFVNVAVMAFQDRRYVRIPANLVIDGQQELLIEHQGTLFETLRASFEQLISEEQRQRLSVDERMFLLATLGFGIEMFGDYVAASMQIERPDTMELAQKLIPLANDV